MDLIIHRDQGDGVTARSCIRFSKLPVIFPVLRENGIIIGIASLRMIGGEGAGMR
jgi:hypothetical protein